MSDDEPVEQPNEVLPPLVEEREAEDAFIANESSESSKESNEQEPTLAQQLNQETSSGNNIASHGDHAHITIYNYYKVVRDAERWSSEDDDDIDETSKKNAGSKDALIAENLRFGRQNIPQFDDSSARTPSTIPTLLENEVQISRWYYTQLDEYEQCYIQAVAILHGALAQEIYKRTDTLYRIVQEQKHIPFQQSPSSPEAPSEAGTKGFQSFVFPRKPRLTVQEKTYTTTRRVNSAERLFWEDVDTNGQSSFGSRVLTFLAKEFLSKGEHWKNFLDTIQSWSSQRGECSWRAARALGVILWHQDVSELRRQAQAWAKRNSMSGRRLAASLLDGAREIECITQQEPTSTTQNSVVLQLLYDWTATFQKNPTKTTISVGCATANTYGFIGKKALDTESALRGVDALLAFKPVGTTLDTRALFAAGVSAYVNLTWAGHLRAVMDYLAIVAKELVYDWRLPKRLEERRIYRLRREARLEATFEAFFLVIAAASPKELNTMPDVYAQPLVAQIAIPDPEKRDIVLTAILTKDTMQALLQELLCAAIISNTEQNRKLAFELIRQWADTVIAFQYSATTSSKPAYHILLQFLVELGETIKAWCAALTQRGYRSPTAYDVYIHKFEQWHASTRKCPMGTFTQDVLQQSKVYSAS